MLQQDFVSSLAYTLLTSVPTLLLWMCGLIIYGVERGDDILILRV